MHRKVIAALLTYGQNGEAVTPLRPKDSAALLLLSRARFPYNRKSTLKFWIFTFVSLFSAVFLFAKPDPDLFDGRLATRSYDSESGSTAGSPDPGGGVEGGEQRDIESVGDPDEGEAAGSTSSKYSSTTEGVRESSGTAGKQASYSTSSSKDEAGSAGTGSSGTPSTEPSGGSGLDNQEPRNFEDFSFGGAGAQETVEVNRSKESTTSTILSSDKRSIPPEGNDCSSAAGQEASGGSRAGNVSLEGDYGTNLPSGL
tara:strand:- start:1021 stop:1788 length:768 start_codon:yes stop_codon:yes gene_type:complete